MLEFLNWQKNTAYTDCENTCIIIIIIVIDLFCFAIIPPAENIHTTLYPKPVFSFFFGGGEEGEGGKRERERERDENGD
jgi:hypothetical protein